MSHASIGIIKQVTLTQDVVILPQLGHHQSLASPELVMVAGDEIISCEP